MYLFPQRDSTVVTLAGYCVHSTVVPAIVPIFVFAPTEEIHVMENVVSNTFFGLGPVWGDECSAVQYLLMWLEIRIDLLFRALLYVSGLSHFWIFPFFRPLAQCKRSGHPRKSTLTSPFWKVRAPVFLVSSLCTPVSFWADDPPWWKGGTPYPLPHILLHHLTTRKLFFSANFLLAPTLFMFLTPLLPLPPPYFASLPTLLPCFFLSLHLVVPPINRCLLKRKRGCKHWQHFPT